MRLTREIAQFTEIWNDSRQHWIERGMSARNFAAAPLLAQLSQRGQRALALPWTFRGHAAKTGNALVVHGWEEWDVGDDLKVTASRGWYDAEDYARQVAGGPR